MAPITIFCRDEKEKMAHNYDWRWYSKCRILKPDSRDFTEGAVEKKVQQLADEGHGC